MPMHSAGKTVSDVKAIFEAISSSANQVSTRASRRFFSDPTMPGGKEKVSTRPTPNHDGLMRGGAFRKDRMLEVKEEKALSLSGDGGAAKETIQEKIQRLTPYPADIPIPTWTAEEMRKFGFGRTYENPTTEERAQDMEEHLSKVWGVKPTVRRSMTILAEEKLDQSKHGLGLELEGLYNRAAAGLINTGEYDKKNEADADQDNDSWALYGGGPRRLERRYGYDGDQEVSPSAGSDQGQCGLGSGAAVLTTPSHANNDTSNPFLESELANDDILTQIDSLLEDQYRAQAESLTSNSRRQTQTPQSVKTKADRTSEWANNLEYTPSKVDHELTTGLRQLRTPRKADRVIVEPIQFKSGGKKNTIQRSVVPDEPVLPATPHATYGHNIYTLPKDGSIHRRSLSANTRPTLYFTQDERESIDALIDAKEYHCKGHENCTDCRNIEYTYQQNKAMSTAIPPEERQKIINNNRSLRNIKNELENLLENGAITDEAYENLMSALPSESSFNKTTRSNGPSPAPSASVPNMSFKNAPPSYKQVQAAPPALPTRKASNKGPSKPEIGRATALYTYSGNDGDCNFEVSDEILILEHVNNDWWTGHNPRTGSEGVFPKNYVQEHQTQTVGGHYNGEKASTRVSGYPGAQARTQNGPPPPGPSSPYNSSAPPMSIADGEPKKPSKTEENSKKIGKKVGNAALFGAGATLGSKLVSSIF